MSTMLLTNGSEVELLGFDEDSGLPLAEVPGLGLIAVTPAMVQEGWPDDRDA